MRRCYKLNEETLDRTGWRTRFERRKGKEATERIMENFTFFSAFEIFIFSVREITMIINHHVPTIRDNINTPFIF